MRLLLDLLIATACFYVMAGTLYWYATLKYEPGRWFFNPRSLHIVLTWPRDIYRRLSR